MNELLVMCCAVSKTAVKRQPGIQSVCFRTDWQ